MQYKNKTFWQKHFSLSEERLCHMADRRGKAPKENRDALTGKSPDKRPTEIIRSNEQQRPYWATIEHALERAVRKKGSNDLKKIWGSPELKEWIMAQVERNADDGRLTWMPPNAQEHAEQHERSYEKNKNRLVKINADLSDAVDKYVTNMQEVIDDIGDGSGLPDDVDGEALKKILSKMTDAKEKVRLRERQHKLTALVRDIVQKDVTKDQLKTQLTNTLKLHSKVFGDDLTKSIEGVIKLLDADKPYALGDKKKLLLKELGKLGIINFSVDDRSTITAAITSLDKAIADQNEDKDGILADVFADQTRYLRSLAGDDRPAVIRSGIRSDGAYSPDLFIKSVRILEPGLTDQQEKDLRSYVDSKKVEVSSEKLEAAVNALGFGDKVEAAKALGIAGNLVISNAKEWADSTLRTILEKGKRAAIQDPANKKYFNFIQKQSGISSNQVCDELVKAWNTKKAEDYMDRELNMHDQVGFSIKALMLRAKMPDDVAKYLIDSEAKIRISDLTKLSAIENLTGGTRFTDSGRNVIYNYVVLNSPGMKEDPAEVDSKFETLVAAYKQTSKAEDKKKLVDYIKIGLQDFPNAINDGIAILDEKAPADIEVSMFKRLAGEAIERTDQTALTTLMKEYKQAVVTGTDKASKKKKLTDFLSDKLKDFSLLKANALRLVTDSFSDAEEDRLGTLLTETHRVVDTDKSTILWEALLKYQAAVGKPDEAKAEDELVKLLDVYLDGDELKNIKQHLNTENNFSKEAADSIYGILVETNNAGHESLDEERFIETISFYFVESIKDDNAKDALEASKEVAKTLWLDLIDKGYILDKGMVAPGGKEKIIERLQRYRVGNTSELMHAGMRTKKLYELTWADNSKRYFSEFVDLAKKGGSSWLEYIKDQGAIIYSSSDKRMGEMLKKRDRLKEVKKGLEEALETADESGEMIERAIKEVTKLQEELDTLSKPLDPTDKIGESVTQALYLLEANAHVIEVLRTENLWDEIPNSVRQTSLWIAMNKGGSSKAGLVEAKKFLRAYHSAPHALEHYNNARNRYFGAGGGAAGQTVENLKQYLSSLDTYQSIAKLDQKLVDDYKASINEYDEALFLKPEHLIEDGTTVIAEADDGTEVTGVVAKILDESDANAVRIQLADGTEATMNFNEYKKAFVEEMKKRHDAVASAYKDASDAFEASLDPRDPASTAYNRFLVAYMNGDVAGVKKMTKKDRTHLLRFRRKIEVVTEIKGSDNLSAMYHSHGLYVKPAAVMALSESRSRPQAAGAVLPEVSLTNGSFSVDRWLNEGHREFADEPLRIILGGPVAARDALIKAYIEKRDVTYPSINAAGVPEDKMVTAEEAFMRVSEIKRLIQWQSEQQHPALEQLGEDELFKDPIQGGFRAMVETMQDMWSGDMVDKAMVVGAVVAAVWLLRHIWKKGGEEGASGFLKMMRYALVGLPILMVANAAYKNRTGRDILGEKLLFMSKPKRDGILEQWRRRSVKYSPDRYGVLNHPAGFAAMQELMRKDDSVPVKDLHNWRMSVKDDGSGYHNYLNGMPDSINLNEVQWRLGGNASKEEAAKVVFMTYEALCVDVAALHEKTSGSLQSRANWGSDYIFREYHLAESYSGVTSGPGKDAPTLQDKIRGRNPGMLDIMLAEAHLPSVKNSVNSELTTVESIAEFLGRSKEWVQTKIVQGYTHVEIMAMKGIEAAPDVWEGAKEWTFETYEDVETWMRVRGIFAGETLTANFLASMKAIKGVGITIMEVSPGVVEFVMDGTVDITSSVLSQIKETHDYILLHEGMVGEIKLVKKFEEFVMVTFGYDFLQELSKEEAETQINTNITQLASFLDGGIYSPIDGKGKYTYSRAYPGERSPSLRFGSTDIAGKFEDLSFQDAQDKITDHMNALALSIHSEADYTQLPVAKQRHLLELLKANLFRNIANHPGTAITVAKYNQELETKKDRLEQATAALRALSPDVATKVIELNEAVEEIEILMTSEPAAIKRALDRKGQELGRELTRLSTITAQLAAVALEIQAGIASGMNVFEMGILNTKKRALTVLKTSARARVDTSMDRVKQLHVFHVMSQNLASADRANRAAYGAGAITTALDIQHNAIVTITVNGAPQQINLRAGDAKHIRDEASRSLKDYNTIKGELAGMNADQERLATEISTLFSEVRGLEKRGVDPVLIKDIELFADAGTNVETLAQNKNARSQAILTKMYDEPWGLVGVSLEKVFGAAGEVAAKRVDSWIQRRLENDQVLKRYAASGKDPAAVAAYPRYLAHIGLSETFMRAMIRESGIGEKISPLHLSYDEAQAMDKYLEETERMVSFAQFLEIWEPFSDAERDKYLP